MKLDSMKLEVYSESMSKVTLDGKEVIFYGGEDTLPYVDDHVLFVADGIGGCSSTRHRKFNRDLFDPDKQFDTLFGKALDEPADDFTRDYLKRCFRDFVGNEPYFDKQMAARRKSAFYGARILSTLLLHKLRSDKSLGIYDGKIFEELHKSKYETVKKKEAYLQTIADKLGAYLHEKLMKVAKDAGFAEDKSSSSAIVMFGTTLCFTIYQETPDKKHVEALYFVAGDSRPYAMADYGPHKGMYQAVSDCEEADGSMTSCICAEERVPINFLCAYRKFRTPCILFNASDGCFDTAGFISQITYEHTIYDTILKSESLKDVGVALSDFFRVNGRHDDCNTMAMRFFGFEPAETSGQESEADLDKLFYANLKQWAEERMAKLEEKYLSKQEGLLDHDYAGELAEFLRPRNHVDCAKALVPLALEDGKLMAYVRSRLSDKKSQEYNQEFVNAVKTEAAEGRKKDKLDADIRLLLKGNLFSLPAPSDPVDAWQTAEELKAEINEKRDYLQKLAKTTLDKLKPLCKAFKDVSDCDPDKYTVKDTGAQVKYRDLLDQLQLSRDEQQGSKRTKQNILSACEIKLQKNAKDLNDLIRAFQNLEKTEAGKEKTYKSFLDKQIAGLLDGSLTVESLKLASDEAKKLEKLRADYESALNAQIEAQNTIDSIITAYVEKNMQNMAIAVFKKELQVDKPLKDAIKGVLEPLKAENIRLKQAADKQASILAEYDRAYYYVINSNQKDEPSEQAEAAATSDDTASGS